jgi:hypothetical protein
MMLGYSEPSQLQQQLEERRVRRARGEAAVVRGLTFAPIRTVLRIAVLLDMGRGGSLIEPGKAYAHDELCRVIVSAVAL